MAAYADLIARLRMAPPNVLLQREAAQAIERLQHELARAKAEAREEQNGTAIEARWQERQGEDYGSY